MEKLDIEKQAFASYSNVDLALCAFFKQFDKGIQKDEFSSSDKNFCRAFAMITMQTMIEIASSYGGMSHDQAVFFYNFTNKEESDYLRYVAETSNQKNSYGYDDLEKLNDVELKMISIIGKRNFEVVAKFIFSLIELASFNMKDKSPLPGLIGNLINFFDLFVSLDNKDDSPKDDKAAVILSNNMLKPLGALPKKK